jgi:ribosomal protein S18 acetylase RimI-like enzyme
MPEAVADGMDREVKTAASGELDRAADVLSAAFIHDPILDWFMREDPKRDAARLGFFRLIVRAVAFPDGAVELTPGGGAAALWIPSEKMNAQPLHRELRALPTLLNATGLDRFARLMALRGAMDAHHPMERAHDYLWFIGVDPRMQGQGLGSILIKDRTNRLDAAGRCAFLQTATPRNVTLYHRHGFEVVADYRPDTDGPLIWAMWRDPKPV